MILHELRNCRHAIPGWSHMWLSWVSSKNNVGAKYSFKTCNCGPVGCWSQPLGLWWRSQRWILQTLCPKKGNVPWHTVATKLGHILGWSMGLKATKSLRHPCCRRVWPGSYWNTFSPTKTANLFLWVAFWQAPHVDSYLYVVMENLGPCRLRTEIFGIFCIPFFC